MLKPIIILVIVLFGQFKSVKIFFVKNNFANIYSSPANKEVKNYKRKLSTSQNNKAEKENNGSRNKKLEEKTRNNYFIYPILLMGVIAIFSDLIVFAYNDLRLLWFGCRGLV